MKRSSLSREVSAQECRRFGVIVEGEVAMEWKEERKGRCRRREREGLEGGPDVTSRLRADNDYHA